MNESISKHFSIILLYLVAVLSSKLLQTCLPNLEDSIDMLSDGRTSNSRVHIATHQAVYRRHDTKQFSFSDDAITVDIVQVECPA